MQPLKRIAKRQQSGSSIFIHLFFNWVQLLCCKCSRNTYWNFNGLARFQRFFLGCLIMDWWNTSSWCRKCCFQGLRLPINTKSTLQLEIVRVKRTLLPFSSPQICHLLLWYHGIRDLRQELGCVTVAAAYLSCRRWMVLNVSHCPIGLVRQTIQVSILHWAENLQHGALANGPA